MEERTRLAVLAAEGSYTVTELAQQFGVSRKTAHKWIERYRAGGLGSMEDRSRAPHSVPSRTAEQIERLVVKERQLHPTWGGKKIQTRLRTRHGIEDPPCIRTVDAILKRNNLVRKRRRRGGVYRIERPELTVATRPHEAEKGSGKRKKGQKKGQEKGSEKEKKGQAVHFNIDRTLRLS